MGIEPILTGVPTQLFSPRATLLMFVRAEQPLQATGSGPALGQGICLPKLSQGRWFILLLLPCVLDPLPAVLSCTRAPRPQSHLAGGAPLGIPMCSPQAPDCRVLPHPTTCICPSWVLLPLHVHGAVTRWRPRLRHGCCMAVWAGQPECCAGCCPMLG